MNLFGCAYLKDVGFFSGLVLPSVTSLTKMSPCWHVCRYTWVTGREPLTYYDMNLSAQDHQTFFTCDTDHLRPADASKRPCGQWD